MMTRIGRRLSTLVRPGPASGMSLILSVGLSLAWPSPVEAARLSRFLTPQDVAGRMILDQNGLDIQLPSAEDRHP